MSKAVIGPFRGPHRIYSNFHYARIVIEADNTRYPTLREFFGNRRIEAPTVEHPYQAAKGEDPDAQDAILRAPTAGAAKRMGRRVRMRPDFEQRKFAVMEELIDAKFRQNPDLAKQLLATGNAEIVEINRWGDRIWGVAHGIGENHLGKTLMRIRARLAGERADAR